MILGGVHDLRGNQNSGEIESLARFAIQEHNNREVFNSSLFLLQESLSELTFVLFSCRVSVEQGS